MGNIFCPVCGSKSTYNLAVPNFCSKCGSAYNSTFVATPTELTRRISSRTSVNATTQRQDPDDEEEFDDDEVVEGGAKMVGSYFSDSTKVPRINKLAVEIDCSTDVRTFKLSDIIKEINDAESI
jgi:hypothetical protein